MKRALRSILTTIFALALAATASAADYGPIIGNVQSDVATVTWVTEEPEPGTVVYGPDREMTITVSDPRPVIFHEIELTGLEPGRHYYYALAESEPNEDGEVEHDQVYSFRTRPEGRDVPFRFVVYGDTRTDADAHKRVIHRVKQLAPDFVLHTGDLVASGESLDDWDDFFGVAGDLLATIPFFVALGNHERDSELYFDIFAMPGNERFYSFDWGNCHFVALDTCSPYAWDRRQLRWLRQDLRKHQDAAFTIVCLHHPPYSISSHGSELFVRETYGPIFEEFGVDLVFAGHDHCYQHCRAGGIDYFVTGGGGAPLYDIGLQRPWFVTGESVYHAIVIEVEGDILTLQAVLPGGNVFDTVKIEAEEPPEVEQPEPERGVF